MRRTAACIRLVATQDGPLALHRWSMLGGRAAQHLSSFVEPPMPPIHPLNSQHHRSRTARPRTLFRQPMKNLSDWRCTYAGRLSKAARLISSGAARAPGVRSASRRRRPAGNALCRCHARAQHKNEQAAGKVPLRVCTCIAHPRATVKAHPCTNVSSWSHACRHVAQKRLIRSDQDLHARSKFLPPVPPQDVLPP